MRSFFPLIITNFCKLGDSLVRHFDRACYWVCNVGFRAVVQFQPTCTAVFICACHHQLLHTSSGLLLDVACSCLVRLLCSGGSSQRTDWFACIYIYTRHLYEDSCWCLCISGHHQWIRNNFRSTFVFCVSNFGEMPHPARVLKICFLLVRTYHSSTHIHTRYRRTELVSLYGMKNGRGHWICWMSVSGKNGV